MEDRILHVDGENDCAVIKRIKDSEKEEKRNWACPFSCFEACDIAGRHWLCFTNDVTNFDIYMWKSLFDSPKPLKTVDLFLENFSSPWRFYEVHKEVTGSRLLNTIGWWGARQNQDLAHFSFHLLPLTPTPAHLSDPVMDASFKLVAENIEGVKFTCARSSKMQ